METTVLERFLKYIAVDTMSQLEKESIPSTEKQKNLARILEEELKAMGASDVKADDHAYVYATIPATTDKKIPTVGFIAHIDTSPAYSDENVKPQFYKNYDGGRIVMNRETGLSMGPEEYPELLNYVGQDVITTDGTTLLGADDKAGIAEIMALAEYLLKHPEIPHGTIKVGFTPDEEVGRGADLFDVEGFHADVAYTVDGGALGELEYENFNAASGKVVVHGLSIHTGSSKGKMKNAILMAMEFQNMLPVFDNPMYTEEYEGFFHLDTISGCVETVVMDYIIRDHDMDKFQKKKAYMERAAAYMNQKYGDGTIELTLKDSYYNMKEKLADHMYLIDIAKDAMKELGIEPIVVPIRGGTDGARLSYMGLPCPNLCTGGHNFHGKFEYITVQALERTTELLFTIVKKFEAGTLAGDR
ncbi:MAG: peptidase T [Hungatella sp.]|nr:peptidase T [Hungatella sp.]